MPMIRRVLVYGVAVLQPLLAETASVHTSAGKIPQPAPKPGHTRADAEIVITKLHLANPSFHSNFNHITMHITS